MWSRVLVVGSRAEEEEEEEEGRKEGRRRRRKGQNLEIAFRITGARVILTRVALGCVYGGTRVVLG